MSKSEELKSLVNNSYTFKGPAVAIGTAMLDGKAIENAWVKIPLRTFNRHGLIAGATGTGKKNIAKYSRTPL